MWTYLFGSLSDYFIKSEPLSGIRFSPLFHWLTKHYQCANSIHVKEYGFIDTVHWWLPESEGSGDVGQMVQTSICKISWRDVMYSMMAIVNNMETYLKVTRRFNTISHQKMYVRWWMCYWLVIITQCMHISYHIQLQFTACYASCTSLRLLKKKKGPVGWPNMS